MIADAILRRRMAFDGLVITDDLDMGAIAKHYGLPSIVQQCLISSVDILLVCHPGPKIQEARDNISALCNSSEDLIRKGEDSLRRILQIKRKYLGV